MTYILGDIKETKFNPELKSDKVLTAWEESILEVKDDSLFDLYLNKQGKINHSDIYNYVNDNLQITNFTMFISWMGKVKKEYSDFSRIKIDPYLDEINQMMKTGIILGTYRNSNTLAHYYEAEKECNFETSNLRKRFDGNWFKFYEVVNNRPKLTEALFKNISPRDVVSGLSFLVNQSGVFFNWNSEDRNSHVVLKKEMDHCYIYFEKDDDKLYHYLTSRT